MDRTTMILLTLGVIVCASVRPARPGKPAWFSQLTGWQKFFGAIALLAALLIIINPEFLALGFLGDTAFFDTLVLLLTLQFQSIAARAWRAAVNVGSGAARLLIPRNSMSRHCIALALEPIRLGFRQFLLAMALAFSPGCASLRTADVQSEHPAQRAQIEQRLRDVLRAAETRDFERLESYHLYGPKFSRFSASSPARQDAAATRKLEHDGLASLHDLKMNAEDLKIDVFGTVGIATFILDYSFTSGAETVRKRDRSTLVFVRDGGQWKIAHEHLSPITVPEPASK